MPQDGPTGINDIALDQPSVTPTFVDRCAAAFAVIVYSRSCCKPANGLRYINWNEQPEDTVDMSGVHFRLGLVLRN